MQSNPRISVNVLVILVKILANLLVNVQIPVNLPVKLTRALVNLLVKLVNLLVKLTRMNPKGGCHGSPWAQGIDTGRFAPATAQAQGPMALLGLEKRKKTATPLRLSLFVGLSWDNTLESCQDNPWYMSIGDHHLI